MSTVVGLFETREKAHRAVEALKQGGFRAEDMSIVMRDRGAAAEVAEEVGVGSGAAAGAVGGGILGGLGGLLVGIGALAIPGIGPIIAAGPLAAALAGAGIGAATGGLLGALVSAGVPEEEAAHYQAGIERGGILLTVSAPDGREAEVRSILGRNGMQDLNQHRSRWESDPNFRFDIDRSDDMTSRRDDRDKVQVDAKAGGTAAGGVAGAVIGGAVGGPIGAGIGAVVGAAAGGLTGSTLDYNEAEPEFRSEWESSSTRGQSSWEQASPAYRYGYESYDKPEFKGRAWDEVRSNLKTQWKHKGQFDEMEPMVRSAWERRAKVQVDAGGQTVVPVVEEELTVGKRKVEKGGVRVETTVTETPVEEQVHLHEEKVKVQRRPVDRAATSADVAFKEGTLELTETAEEAVVAKRARVIEEVVITKEGRDHTETVRDTVRRTDVDVTKTAGTEKVVSTEFATFDTDFRTHHQSHFATSGSTYDQFTPAYRFGYNLGGDERYRGSWTTVEPEARRVWEERNKGTWEEFKDAVRYSWEKVTGQK